MKKNVHREFQVQDASSNSEVTLCSVIVFHYFIRRIQGAKNDCNYLFIFNYLIETKTRF